MAKTKADAIVAKLVRRRLWIQAGFALMWLDPFMLRLHNMCGPVFHCYSCPLATLACPIGVIANFSAIHVVPFIAIGMLVVLGSALGALVCGWICPFGLLQDLLGKIPTPKLRLPAWSGYFRYGVLILFVLTIPYLFGEDYPLFFCRLCPAGALEGALPNMARQISAGNEIIPPSPVKMTILILVLAAMFFTQRPWCTLFCPLGAIYGLFNRISILFLRFSTENCKECNHCEAFCRYGVLPNSQVNNSRCIRCLECTRCNALKLGSIFGRFKRKNTGPQVLNHSKDN